MAISTGQSFARQLEILDTQGRVTEILEPGGTIISRNGPKFQQVCAGAFQLLADKKIVGISGSLPPGVQPKPVPRRHLKPNLRIVWHLSIPVACHCPKRWPPDRNLVKIIGRAEFCHAGCHTGSHLRGAASRKLLDLGANSASSASAIAALSAFEARSAGDSCLDALAPKSTVGCGDRLLLD